MEYLRLINDYLEGAIDKAEEQKLFSELSSNETLRDELKQAIELDKVLSKRISAFVPTSQATFSLFNQLGIGAAAGLATGAATVGFKSVVSAFLAKYAVAIVSSMITLGVTTGGFIMYNNSKSNSDLVNKNKIEEASSNVLSSLVPPSQPPTISSFEQGVDNHYYNRFSDYPENKTKTIIKYVYLEKKVKSDEVVPEIQPNILANNQENNSTQQNSTITNESAFTLSPFSSSIYYNKLNSYSTTTQQLHANYSPISENIHFDISGFSVLVNGNSSWSLNKIDIPTYSTPAFNNMSLGLFYAVSNNFSLGVEFRQENFYQSFKGKNELGDEFIYKQNPNYVSMSILSKYKFLKMGDYSAFGQIGLGATATGAVSRMMLGLQFAPASSFTFFVGIEGSVLSYYHQNILYNSPKLGLNYGLLFNL